MAYTLDHNGHPTAYEGLLEEADTLPPKVISIQPFIHLALRDFLLNNDLLFE